MIILGSDIFTYCKFNEPSAYLEIEGIKHFEVRDVIQEKAKEQGIDWYDYWTNLEYFEVFSYDD